MDPLGKQLRQYFLPANDTDRSIVDGIQAWSDSASHAFFSRYGPVFMRLVRDSSSSWVPSCIHVPMVSFIGATTLKDLRERFVPWSQLPRWVVCQAWQYREELAEIFNKEVWLTLSPEARRIIVMKSNGKNYREIADELEDGKQDKLLRKRLHNAVRQRGLRTQRSLVRKLLVMTCETDEQQEEVKNIIRITDGDGYRTR